MKMSWVAVTAILAFAGSATAQIEKPDPFEPDYSALSLYQYYQDDSLLMQGAFGVIAGKYLGTSHFVYEYQRDLIPFVRFRGRQNKDRVASTTLVMAMGVAVQAWTMALAGKDDDQIERVMLGIMAPFGSHLGYRPIEEVTFYAGLVPDIILFTEDNGLLIRAQLGVRIDPHVGLAFNVGIAKTTMFGFGDGSGNFPMGVSAGVSFPIRKR